MWGRAGQVVLSVIAIVLLYPARAFLEAPAIGNQFLAEGRAFAALPDAQIRTEPTPVVPQRSLTSYVRRTSHGYVAPAKRTALIVGINNAAGTSPLPGSIRDATNLHDALIGYGFREENITLLLEGSATRPAILSALDALAARTPANGVAVFAIATHTRRSGGTNSLATAEGARISAGELASRLRNVRAPAWIALPTCYAAGYALPGIVGFNRVATFASSADRESYQAGDAGSFLFIHMVRRAMVEGRAPFSVETAFDFAHRELARQHPEYLPSINDGYPGDLVLGPVEPIRTDRWEQPSDSEERSGWEAFEYRTYEAEDPNHGYPEPSPTPAASEQHRSGNGWSVCGSVRYNCN